MGKSFLYPYYESIPGDGVTHGMKWMSVGNNRMVKMVSLYPIYYALFS